MLFSRHAFIIASLSCLLPVTAIAETPAATPPTAAAAAPASTINPNAPVSRGELPGLIKEAIMNDPDIIMSAIEKIRAKDAQKSTDETKQGLAKHKDELFNDTTSPSIGDAKTADVTVVEFFDYHCGYCKQLMPAILKLTQEDKKVRVIFREFPILSEDSVAAARAALGVNRISKDKYFNYHVALMKIQGRFDEKTLLDVAKKEGIDTDKLKGELNNPDSTAMLDKNRGLAEDLGIRGTPAVIIGDQLFPGAMPYDDLRSMVERARNGKKKDNAAPAASDAPKS